MTFRTPLLLLVAATAGALVWAQQSAPKPAPGGRKDPGLFGGDREKKGKGDDENTRAVAGYVRDAREDPVEGAVVQIKDLKTLRVRSYITKADGIYRFFGLSTNADYELRADYRTFASPVRTLSIYDSRRQATLNLKLEPKAVEPKAKEPEKTAKQ